MINDIDAGNSNITDTDALEIAKILNTYTDKTQKVSKYKACEYLNISRATFDNYVREGLLPRGNKEAGFKEVFWTLKDLDKFKESRKHGNRKNI